MIKRFVELDILRGLAIIGVILIHITAESMNYMEATSISESIMIGINQISRFAVPIFLFLSGFGLTISNKANQKYFTFLRIRISKIITLYLIWSILYFVLIKQSLNPFLFVKDFLTGGAHYHLYYVPLIIFFYFLYPLLLKIGKSNIGLVMVLLVSILSQIGDQVVHAPFLNNPQNVFNWVFYFVLGIWMANNFNEKLSKIRNRKSLILITFVLVLLGIYSETYLTIDEIGAAFATTTMRPSVILYSILFILFVFSFKWRNKSFNKILLVLSDKSYGMYLSHVFVLSIYTTLYSELGLDLGSMTYTISAFIIVTITSFAITVLLDKIIASIKTITKRKGKRAITTT